MGSWFSDAWAYIVSLLPGVDMRTTVIYVAEKLLAGLLQSVAVVAIGWLVLFRQWRQIMQGRSDQVIFSANIITRLPVEQQSPSRGEQHVLQIRTILPPRTVDQLLDNVALRRMMRHLAEECSLADPILATQETAGFEILNDIVNCVAGSLASSPHPREPWLMAVTCEDRKVVRKCCIRVLLVLRSDIERLASWEWCRDHLLVENWYHYLRVVTLHQIAQRFLEQEAHREQRRAQDIKEDLLPLVDRQAHHPRIRVLSLGLNRDEPILRPPAPLDWGHYLPKIAKLGLKLPGRPNGKAD
jgi:hypothetical protein